MEMSLILIPPLEKKGMELSPHLLNVKNNGWQTIKIANYQREELLLVLIAIVITTTSVAVVEVLLAQILIVLVR